jgi:hypothetical protein
VVPFLEIIFPFSLDYLIFFVSMPHGDFSDISGLVLLVAGLQHIFKPEYFTQDIGPIKACFETLTPELLVVLKMYGGFMVIVGCMLFTVRWNPTNGKLAGIALLGTAANFAMTAMHNDGGVFVPRLFYVYAAVMALGGLKVCLFPNPAIKPAAEDPKKK